MSYEQLYSWLEFCSDWIEKLLRSLHVHVAPGYSLHDCSLGFIRSMNTETYLLMMLRHTYFWCCHRWSPGSSMQLCVIILQHLNFVGVNSIVKTQLCKCVGLWVVVNLYIGAMASWLCLSETVWMDIYQSLSCQIHAGTNWHETGIITVGHCPLCVYPLSTWCHCTWPDLPGLPPPYLHTASDQILAVGTKLTHYCAYDSAVNS